MAESATTGTEDRRPRRAEEVWIAIGPFSRIGKRAVLLAILVLFALGVGIWWELHGIRKERERNRVGQELMGKPPERK